MPTRTPFIADERTLKWCVRQVRQHARDEDGMHFFALQRAADQLLDRAPRLTKQPRKPTKTRKR
jgi:hypothetical protein